MIYCPAELSHYKLYRKPHETVFLRKLYSEERGCINETNYYYSIITPPLPILVAKSNRQKGGGGGKFE